MTVLGKILVFVNLAFTLIVAGLIVEVFMTRTNWRNGYEERDKELKIARASLGAEQQMRDTMLRAKDEEIAARKGDIDNQKKEIDRLNGELNLAKKDLASSRESQNVEQTNNVAATNEMGKLARERDMLNEQVKVRNEKLLAYEKSIIDFRNDAVSAQIQARSLNEKLQNLMVKYEVAVRENYQMKSNGATVPGTSMKVAPVEVKGTVTEVFDNLVTFSLGSDHGLSVGTVLQAYRLSPSPQYLGTITVTNLETHRAAGRFTPAVRNATIMKGDTVDTRVRGP
jgi:hypothetical protein